MSKARKKRSRYSSQARRAIPTGRPTKSKVTPSEEVSAPVMEAAPRKRGPKPASIAGVQNRYLAAELRIIGVLAAIILVVLAVLALVIA